jgi:FKBP-type peptidyl-prolyl cis-trans isomerase FklB
MRFGILALVSLAFALSLVNAQDKKALTDKKDRISYALGAFTADYWLRQGLELNELDWDLLARGFQDALTSKPALLTDPEYREALRLLVSDVQGRAQAKRDEQRRQILAQKKKLSDAFLAQNKAQPGVQTLPNGLQYQVLKEGHGASPTSNDSIIVNYRGTLMDGKQFDTSPQLPLPLPVAGVQGWVQALQLMKPGAQWHVVIPPELAYGERGSGPNIGPYAPLIYDIELVSVQAGGASAGKAALPVPTN